MHVKEEQWHRARHKSKAGKSGSVHTTGVVVMSQDLHDDHTLPRLSLCIKTGHSIPESVSRGRLTREYCNYSATSLAST